MVQRQSPRGSNMFKKNDRHLQKQMLSTVGSLPQNELELLEGGWAATFYTECFCRIDESAFAVLYADVASRPNIPVNILVGLETLKAGFGWSDEEMIHAFYFDLEVRYALGLCNLGDQHFELRTMYNFRRRLSQHMQETGENLIERAFEQVTDEQVSAFELKTDHIRMDSTQVASNIREVSRLQLLVEVLQRVHRMLNEVDQTHYVDDFAPYVIGSSGQYVYRVRSEDGASHIQRIGALMRRLVNELADAYVDEPTYRMLRRVFDEHFTLEETQMRPKQGKELSSQSLQSPDDLGATFRRKRGREYTGYVTNVSETCDLDNELQLIVKVQTAPNTIDDPTLLEEALPTLKERLDVDELYTDGGYNSEKTSQLAHDLDVDHVQTAIRGHSPQGLGLYHFDTETTDAGTPVAIACPQGQRVAIASGRRGRYIARFDVTQCNACPLRDQCPTRLMKRTPQRSLYFDRHGLEIARRRKRIFEGKHPDRNVRAAVESTIAAIKRPFHRDKLPVRGLFRVASMMVASSAMFNVRRIHRYLANNPTKNTENPAAAVAALPLEPSILLSLHQLWRRIHPLCAQLACPSVLC